MLEPYGLGRKSTRFYPHGLLCTRGSTYCSSFKVLYVLVYAGAANVHASEKQSYYHTLMLVESCKGQMMLMKLAIVGMW